MNQDDEPSEVARRLGQSALAEAGIDTAFELRHGTSDVVSGQLHVVSGGACRRHVTTVGDTGARTVAFVRWIVDAMNVIGSRPDGWWTNRHRAMLALVDQLEGWASTGGRQVTVVFERPPSPPILSSVIDIGHAPQATANSADDEIVRLVRAADRPEEITVVTSDAALADRVGDAGASVYPAASFRNLIDPLH